jgi:hypothetical protein
MKANNRSAFSAVSRPTSGRREGDGELHELELCGQVEVAFSKCTRETYQDTPFPLILPTLKFRAKKQVRQIRVRVDISAASSDWL